MKKSVVVVGAGLGGLSAAVHARLKGHEVLVLEQGRIGGKAGRISEKGYTLDPGPSIIILPEIYKDVFRRANRNPDDYLKFKRLDPITRVYLNGDIIDIPAGYDKALELIKEVAPEDAKSFAIMWSKLLKVAPLIDDTVFDHPYDKPWQLMDPKLIRTALPFDVRRTYKELVDGLFQSPLLRAFYYGFPSYGGQSYRSKAPGALLIPFYMLESGVWYPEGGVAAIPEAFTRLAQELGVEIRTQSKVVGFKFNGDKILGVELESGEVVEADIIISNRDRVSIGSWLGQEPPAKPSYSYFTVHLGLKRNYPELKHHSLVVPQNFVEGFEELYEDRVFPKNPIVYLNNTSDTDSSVAPQGSTNLFAVVTSPAKEDHLNWEQIQNECRERTLSVVRSARIDIQDSEIEFERIQTPNYFESAHGSFKGSLYGADEKYRLFGLFPWSNRDPVHKNLFYVGGAVQPGAGLPMVTLSGKFVAEMI